MSARQHTFSDRSVAALSPDRVVIAGTLVLAGLGGALIVIGSDLKTQMQAILGLGLAGLLALTVIPNQRIALVCAWVLAHPLSLEKVFPVFQPSHPKLLAPSVVISGSDLVLYTLVCVLLFEALAVRKVRLVWAAPMTTWALLGSWAFLAFFVTSPSAVGALQLVHWIKTLIFLVAFTSAVRTRHEFFTVLVAAAAAVLMQSAIVATAYVTKKKVSFSSKVAAEAMMTFSGGQGSQQSFTRATGTVGHVNQQAMFHTFFTIPLIGMVMVKNWLWRVFFSAAIIASFCALILTFSRASWIACSVAGSLVLVVAWKRGKINRAGWLAVCLGAIGALGVLGFFSGSIAKRIFKGDDGASSSRLRMMALAGDYVLRNPITGVGPGNFVNAAIAGGDSERAKNVWLGRGENYKPRYLGGLELYEVEIMDKWYYMPGVVHNKILLMAAEMGFVGLGLFLFFQLQMLRINLRCLRTRDTRLWWCALGLFAAFWAVCLEFMFELFYDDKTVMLPLFVNAMTMCLARVIESEEEIRCVA